jgi:hypothetical protein
VGTLLETSVKGIPATGLLVQNPLSRKYHVQRKGAGKSVRQISLYFNPLIICFHGSLNPPTEERKARQP